MEYNFEDPSKYNCMNHSFHNFGYMRATLPKPLFHSLKKYCEQFYSAKPKATPFTSFSRHGSPKAEKYITGLTQKYDMTAPHYELTKELKESVWDFTYGMMRLYDHTSRYSKTLKSLTSDLPFLMDDPWINVQDNIDYLPIHCHDGVYSYTFWINLPPKSLFQFMYTSSIGSPMWHDIKLTPKDEGDMIIFPAGLQHCVHPFREEKPYKRMSLSGNVLLNSSKGKT